MLGLVDRAKSLALGGAVAVGVAMYLTWRPAMLRWGTEGAEAVEALPGDDLVANPRFLSTRAITIDAPPERVWPWIVQIGIYRAGSIPTTALSERYSTPGMWKGSTLRHASTRSCRISRSATLCPMAGGVYAAVAEVEPNRYLVAGEAFVLRPLRGNRTRLIIRYRGTGYISAAAGSVAGDAPPVTKAIAFAVRYVPGAMLLARGIDVFVGDPLHHYMEIGVLRGIKQRAEGENDNAIEGDGTTSAAVEPVAEAT